MNQYTSGWTDVRVTRLRQLLRQGSTDAEIAAQLGISRRAVIGKRQRLGLEANRRRQIADARAVNEAPWEPPPGMVKRRCRRCQYQFAAWSDEIDLCLECVLLGTNA